MIARDAATIRSAFGIGLTISQSKWPGEGRRHIVAHVPASRLVPLQLAGQRPPVVLPEAVA